MKKIFIVDDAGERGRHLLDTASAQADTIATWLRPTPDVVPPGPSEIHCPTLDALEQYVLRELSEPAVWIWDIKLLFPMPPHFDVGDYYIGRRAFQLLLKVLMGGGSVVIISQDFHTEQIASGFRQAGVRTNAIKALTANYYSLNNDAASNFCTEAIQSGLRSLADDIDNIWYRKGWEKHFADPQAGGIPHEFSECAWDDFHPLLTEILGGSHYVPSFLVAQLEKNFEGYFEAVKTLVGDFSLCHSGKGHEPCLSVLSVLFLRAACLSGFWSQKDRILQLAEWVAPTPGMRHISLSCAKYQDKEKMREWLRLLSDSIFPSLVKDHQTDRYSDIISIISDEHGQFFRITFRGAWKKLATCFHDLSEANAGSLGSSLRLLNSALGDCGPTIGRRQFCAVSAWLESGCTHIEFLALRRP